MFKVPTYISPQEGGLLTMEIMLCLNTDNDCDWESALLYVRFPSVFFCEMF